MSIDAPQPESQEASLRTRCVEAFLESLHGPQPQPLEAFLPKNEHRQLILVELVHAELEYRLKRGEAVRVEDYLARFEQLANDPRAVQDLFVAEMRFRSRPWQSDVANQSQATQLPGYELLGELGRGAVGVVYRARQVALGRDVAVKMLLAQWHGDTDAIARFQTEARAVAALAHPNIVGIYDIGEAHARPFFAMELVEGGTLGQRLADGPQDSHWSARLVEALARAIHEAHQRDIIHRDLKPSNVLLGENDQPKVTDFGLARILFSDSQATRTGQVIGTPGFMSPEQARGDLKAVGPTSDVHALGAILYQCLTGRPPFAGANVLTTLEQVRTHPAVPPRQLQPKLPRDLDTICLKCLEKNPQQRYPSALALAEDLGRFLRGEAILARPIGTLETTVRWVRRNPAISVLLTTVVVVLLLATTVSSYLALAAQSALEDAKQHRLRADERTRQAFNRIATVHMRLRSPQFGKSPEVAELRKTLDVEAKFFISAFIDESNPDPLIRFESAQALLYRAGIQETMADMTEDYRRAVRVMKSLVKEYPRDARYIHELGQAHNHLGTAFRKQGMRIESKAEVSEAFHYFEKAADLDRTNRRWANNFAWCLCTTEELDLRDFNKAIRYADISLKIVPDNYATLNTLGVAQYRAGQYKEAVETLHKALQNSPVEYQVYNLFFLSMAQTKLGNLREARACFDRAELWRLNNRKDGDEVAEFAKEARDMLPPRKID